MYSERGKLRVYAWMPVMDMAVIRTLVQRDDNQPDDEVKIDVIQGGLGMGEHPRKRPPIPHETTAQTGLRHEDGTLSMSRLAPGSANKHAGRLASRRSWPAPGACARPRLSWRR